MMFIELFVPKGALSADQRRRISERLITEFMTDEEEHGAPAAVLEAARSIWQVVVHEPETWIVGGRPVDPDEPPRYMVRVSVPGSWRKDMSGEVVSRVTRVLAEGEEDPRRLYDEPAAWVHVVGISEGSLGAFGQVMESADIVKMITKPFRESPDRDAAVAAAAAGTAIDPICGMTVELTDEAITMEHDGTTYAFCAPGCRQVFIQERRAATASVR